MELGPCPFCGSSNAAPIHVDGSAFGWVVWCPDCGAQGPGPVQGNAKAAKRKAIRMWSGRRSANAEQIKIHDEITQTAIVGILSISRGGESYYPSWAVKTAEELMKFVRRRGYAPQIRRFNQLLDGTNI